MNASDSNTRDRLVQAAIELIFRRGYADVGVQELCERADVKKGSFYHHFPSKRDLTLAALEVHWAAYRVGIEQCVHAKLPPLERIQYLFDVLHRRYKLALEGGETLTGCAFGSLSMEVSAHDPVLRVALEGVFEDWAALFEGVFRDAVQNGELPQTTNTTLAGKALLAYLEGVLLLVKTSQNPDLLRQLQPTTAQFQSFGRL